MNHINVKLKLVTVDGDLEESVLTLNVDEIPCLQRSHTKVCGPQVKSHEDVVSRFMACSLLALRAPERGLIGVTDKIS